MFVLKIVKLTFLTMTNLVERAGTVNTGVINLIKYGPIPFRNL